MNYTNKHYSLDTNSKVYDYTILYYIYSLYTIYSIHRYCIHVQ